MIIAVSGGIVVGSAAAAFITLLDVFPRLVQLSDTRGKINIYERIVIFAMPITTLIHFLGISFKMGELILIPIGVILGIFIGLLASALAEVINVIPILIRRLKVKEYVYYVLVSMAVGKVVGSLFHWVILNKNR